MEMLKSSRKERCELTMTDLDEKNQNSPKLVKLQLWTCGLGMDQSLDLFIAFL